MSVVRPKFLTRISGQITALIVVSLLAFHAITLTGLYLSHRFENQNSRDDAPGEIVALIRFAASTPRGEPREAVLLQIARTFPRVALMPAASMPDDAGENDPSLRLMQDRLGPSFQVASLPDDLEHRLAIRLPDGDVLTVRAPFSFGPLFFIVGPFSFTVLLLIVSLTSLLLWAARALSAPLSAFARAAESFSLDRDDAALPERGPEEIRAVARAFNRMRDRIRKLVDDRMRMLAAMGHDLRTPITRMRLRSEFIADDELRGEVLRDLGQMRAMTDDALSFLRDGHTQEPPTTVDLASTLQTVCDQYADMGQNVTYNGPEHLTITGQPGDLQRAVNNLVDNAVRYGTTVVVRLATDDDSAIVTVEDDGPGIEDCRKEAMLEAFVRGEEARTMDDRSGFGLGLSITRAIADAHGGMLSLHDRTPHGLRARIALPRR